MSEPPRYVGPISTQRRKAALQEIAEALSIDSTGTVKELVARIRTHVKEHDAELSMDPRFQGLTSDGGYRVGVGGRSKSTGKTSIEKAAEDAIENDKPQKAPTG